MFTSVYLRSFSWSNINWTMVFIHSIPIRYVMVKASVFWDFVYRLPQEKPDNQLRSLCGPAGAFEVGKSQRSISIRWRKKYRVTGGCVRTFQLSAGNIMIVRESLCCVWNSGGCVFPASCNCYWQKAPVLCRRWRNGRKNRNPQMFPKLTEVLSKKIQWIEIRTNSHPNLY